MNEREQIITFLLQQCDGKQRIIEELQKKLAELQKESATEVAAKEIAKKKADKPITQ